MIEQPAAKSSCGHNRCGLQYSIYKIEFNKSSNTLAETSCILLGETKSELVKYLRQLCLLLLYQLLLLLRQLFLLLQQLLLLLWQLLQVQPVIQEFQQLVNLIRRKNPYFG